MSWVVAILALLVASAALWKAHTQTKTIQALQEEREKHLALESTVVELMDEDGLIRGQLALPGGLTPQSVPKRLMEAEQTLGDLRKGSETLHSELEASEKKMDRLVADLAQAHKDHREAVEREKKTAQTLAEVLDQDGSVLHQIRLPGKKMTPCGALCFHAYFNTNKQRWVCNAHLGWVCLDARKHLSDENGTCLMYEKREKLR